MECVPAAPFAAPGPSRPPRRTRWRGIVDRGASARRGLEHLRRPTRSIHLTRAPLRRIEQFNREQELLIKTIEAMPGAIVEGQGGGR